MTDRVKSTIPFVGLHAHSVAGSPFDVELKAIATGANSSGSEGSYAVFKRDSYVRVYAPSPIPKVV